MPEPTPKYHVEETTKTIYREERTVYTVVRADGTPAGRGEGQDPRILNATYDNRGTAEAVAEFYSRTPAGYRLTRELPLRAAQRPYWRVTGRTDGDPSSMKLDWEDGAQVPAWWPAGTTSSSARLTSTPTRLRPVSRGRPNETLARLRPRRFPGTTPPWPRTRKTTTRRSWATPTASPPACTAATPSAESTGTRTTAADPHA
ncbi:hypothetical protein [Streptomyces sp. CBG31]|uniref:hypothetical protein n=1 Tax=Streptomyces sp. CBG31 TaxID=2762623 RepID=UPI0016492032|nr:hypothetical protein [Streptomyces sp. CBG31]